MSSVTCPLAGAGRWPVWSPRADTSPGSHKPGSPACYRGASESREWCPPHLRPPGLLPTIFQPHEIPFHFQSMSGSSCSPLPSPHGPPQKGFLPKGPTCPPGHSPSNTYLCYLHTYHNSYKGALIVLLTHFPPLGPCRQGAYQFWSPQSLWVLPSAAPTPTVDERVCLTAGRD